MEKELTQKQKDRIVKRWQEKVDQEFAESKKRLKLLENPETNKLASELQHRLVQCCLDFINETGNTDIDRVMFTADCLQGSAKYKTWQPCTDSTCELEKLTNNGYDIISFSA